MMPPDRAPDRRRTWRRWLIAAFAGLWIATGIWQTIKPMPSGTDVDSGDVPVVARDIEFLHDLTYRQDGKTVHEQEIFDAVLEIVDGAQHVLILDFFLFNDQAGNAGDAHRALSRELKERLIARKRARPGLDVVFVTDPINDVYGGDPSPMLAELEAAGIVVVRTDLTRLRDSNPAWSALWRLFAQVWGNSPAISWLPNPFADGPSRISLRSWLALLNFKANHRKVIVADTTDGRWSGLVTSANPHDASSAHSNVAFRFSGALVLPALNSELAVAAFSGGKALPDVPDSVPDATAGDLKAAFVTEHAIRDRLLAGMEATAAGDSIDVAMFYLSDRRIVQALLAAARRGVRVRLILDPNRDAFGIEKDGIPNRPVANELVTESGGAIEVRWYQTRGEQFHSKLVLVTRGRRVVASLGSANLTRRNLGNYNLEANIEVDMPQTSPLAQELTGYFERLWTNRDGAAHTLPFTAWEDTSRLRYWRYRLMEATGLSTF